MEKIAEDQKIMERLTNKRGLLIKKREECMRKIRELGSLPADTNTKYQSLSLKEVCSVCIDATYCYIFTKTFPPTIIVVMEEAQPLQW